MFRYLLNKRLNSAERQFGESLDYLRHILRFSLPAFLRFGGFVPLSSYRRVLPPEPWHVARMVATREADCGTCLQLVVNVAKKSGVSHDILRAVLDRRSHDLPKDLADCYRFSEAVVRATGEEDALREHLRARYGEAGLFELALAIASCGVFPVAKRALGYAKSCALVNVEV